MLGALSLTVGQSVVLFANRVPRSRFFLSVVANMLTLTLTAVDWFLFLAVVLWLVGAEWSLLGLLALLFPGHWRLMRYSKWNRARRHGRVKWTN